MYIDCPGVPRARHATAAINTQCRCGGVAKQEGFYFYQLLLLTRCHRPTKFSYIDARSKSFGFAIITILLVHHSDLLKWWLIIVFIPGNLTWCFILLIGHIKTWHGLNNYLSSTWVHVRHLMITGKSNVMMGQVEGST